jgi:hypothetical protein
LLRAYSWNQEKIIVGEPVLAGKRHALFDAIFVRGMHGSRATQGAAALRAFALEQMPLASAGTQHLAARGNLEPLGRGFLGFDALRTSHKDKSAFVKKEREI